MATDIHGILKSYWGYDRFRPMQEDIIHAVLDGQDTLALLPTGGGKSLCFQVPVLAMEGLGIVISPLIALMEDQVGRLQKMDIKAIALSSKLSYAEFDLALDNAVNGYYKFLYISPERLQNEMVQERLKRMKVNLIAVDEAHCISQWGYDFRPSYLQISELRQILKDVPVLALTATATPRVVTDIQEKLKFGEARIFQKSFFRPNLFYNVLKTERKWNDSLDILRKIKGSGIVYSRNRKHTVEIARWLQGNGINAEYYHAGLSAQERSDRQAAWLKDEIRIMVCTNAFGMGIDKPDVRLVLHLELPDSLEAYFQEAGRAGRDGRTAYSVMVTDPSDLPRLKSRYIDTFPDLPFVQKVYHALANTFQLATGSGNNQIFDFHFSEFSQKYGLPGTKLYQALSILEKEGLLRFEENIKLQSRAHLMVDRGQLYDFQLRNPALDPLIKTLMRSYGGMQTEYVAIDEARLAQRLKTTTAEIYKGLQRLRENRILDYLPAHHGAKIIWCRPRVKSGELRISDENLRQRFVELKKRIQAVCDFIEQDRQCRSQFVLHYFGERESVPCGGCDYCRKNSGELSNEEFEKIRIEILEVLAQGSKSMEELAGSLHSNKENWSQVLKWLVDNNEINLKGHIFESSKNR